MAHAINCLEKNKDEVEALLNWKSTFDNHNQSLLSSWHGNNLCCFIGIACNYYGAIIHLNLSNVGLRGTLDGLDFSCLTSVVSFELTNNLIYGSIPLGIGNLSKLNSLDLCLNELFGEIPPVIGMLESLHHLYLSFHEITYLASIPQEIYNSRSLTVISLWGNRLSGSIHSEIARLTSLDELYLSSNNLIGSIPHSIGNLSNLFLSSNNLTGSIPHSIRNLSNLSMLKLSKNNLVGPIPTSLGKLGNLTIFDISQNAIFEITRLTSLDKLELSSINLTGSIPHSIGNLSNLSMLKLSKNNLAGPIPTSLGKLGNLTIFDISHNAIFGSIPSEIGRLTSLDTLVVSFNSLISSIPHSIGNLSSLSSLDLYQNNLVGPIPALVGSLANLTSLTIGVNMFSGSLPSEFNRLTRLTHLDMNDNKLEGELPKDVCLGRSLVYFFAFKNHFTGPIPKSLESSLGIYPHLNYVDLSHNNLNSELSWKWEHCPNLTSLRVSNNQISSDIPAIFGRMAQLRIPRELGSLSMLLELDLSSNAITGNVPTKIGLLSHLVHLNLASNNLSGLMLVQLSSCKSLLTLNLILNISHNCLFGSIPHTFGDMLALTSIDLFYNNLEGPLPNVKAFNEAPFEAMQHKKGLCGNVIDLLICNSIESKKHNPHVRVRIAIILCLSLLGIILLSCTLIVLIIINHHRRRIIKRENNEHTNDLDFMHILNYEGKIFYDRIFEATEGFDSKYYVGKGAHVIVYKANISKGQTFAIKQASSSQDNSETIDLMPFESEIQALRNLRHRNMVKFMGYALMFNAVFWCMSTWKKGSLRTILNDNERAVEFHWNKRVNVVRGVADALSYMHHKCSPPLIYRDLTSNNVLLDRNYEAHVSHFGTARLLRPDSSNWTIVVGTIGYIAPGTSWLIFRILPEKCDIYSFGVIALETIMGNHPGNHVFEECSSSTQIESPILLKDVLDQHAQDVVSIAKLAFTCLQADLRLRLTMGQVSRELCVRVPLEKPLSAITLKQLRDINVKKFEAFTGF
ncbi:hypothetical protein EUGRSUZ_K02366, partial [Eucalyptus grandis]